MPKVKVRIPAALKQEGDVVTANFNGEDVTYPVTDNTVNVEPQHLDAFLKNFEDSHVANTVTDKKDDK